MSKKNREGLSKRQEFREKRRRAERLNRLIMIISICVIAVAVAFVLIYPQVKPIAAVQPATPVARPTVSANTTGDPNAPVKLVEFSDYQCPYCKKFWQETEPQIIDAYVKTGKVQFTFRSGGNWVSDNIDSQTGGTNTESEDAAMAAYCAGDQNKFWNMHDLLFTNVIGENAGSYTPRRLQAMAQSIGLDMNAFNACISSNKYKSQTRKDFQDAMAANIDGTPFFLVTYTANGQTQTQAIHGAQPFSAFQQQLDAALAAAGAK